MMGCPPSEMPTTSDTTMPNTFMTMPTTASGMSAPWADWGP